MELVDRKSEMELLTGLLTRATERTSTAVVVRGEPGIGKTALLDALAARAANQGMRVARVTGVESEAPLGYAALHRLLLGFPGLVERLPAPQRYALESTFGLVAGPPPERFLVGLGALTLLAEAASGDGLLCIVDDAHWLDHESAAVLGFTARRVQAEGVVMVFGARDLSEVAPALQGLPEVFIGALDDGDAAELLAMIAPGRVSAEVAARLVAEGGGNPLALVELAGELTPAQLAGSADLPDPLPAAESLQQMFSRRLSALSPSARLLLALAAAEPATSGTALWRAAELLGVDADEGAVEVSGLAELGESVTFRHPLVRSVVYHTMPPARRRQIHRALAESIDEGAQPDRVAWHLAMAATGPDEALAARLVEVAGRAMERGGYAANATFLARAAELSADDDQRTDRLLAAAEAALTAGRLDHAQALLDQAESGATSDRQAATALRLGGQVSFAAGRPDAAARELLVASLRLPQTERSGRATLLAALTAANWATREAQEEVRAAARRVDGTPVELDDPSSTADCLLLGLLHRLSGATEKAVPLLRAAMGHLRNPTTPDAIRLEVPVVLAAAVGLELLDDRATCEVIDLFVRSARRAGALTVIPAALTSHAWSLMSQGRFDDAAEACVEARELGEATGTPGSPDTSVVEFAISCWRGHEEQAQELAARIGARAQRPRDDNLQAHHFFAVLELGLGHYRQAYDHLLPELLDDRLAICTTILPDLVEAAARSGEFEVAQQALDRLGGRAQASGAAWGLGCFARSQALLAGDAAEPLHRQAVDHLEGILYVTDLAKAHLLYGEWLRRQRRRRDARVELGSAYDMFTEMGVDAYASRARAELQATGERARPRSVETAQGLTTQEAQVARLVAEGGTNREIAAELFLSPATVDSHLRKVYQKLGVTSRTQLARRMLSTS
jgi:DNA-binding CsgD family transcriptional regulator